MNEPNLDFLSSILKLHILWYGIAYRYRTEFDGITNYFRHTKFYGKCTNQARKVRL